MRFSFFVEIREKQAFVTSDLKTPLPGAGGVNK